MYNLLNLKKIVTGAFGEFWLRGWARDALLPSEIVYKSSGPALLQGTERLLQILTHSATGRTQELLLKNICHRRPVANSISTT